MHRKIYRMPTGVQLGLADHAAFTAVLIGIQNALSQNWLDELQRLTTSDMYNYFSSLLEENKRHSLTHHIEQILVLNQKLKNVWQENNVTYARVLMTWRALDYIVNDNLSPNNPEFMAAGNPEKPLTTRAIWTFVRHPNSQWQLAEIG